MSRVIKKTGDFIPQKLFPQQDHPPVWQKSEKPENKFRSSFGKNIAVERPFNYASQSAAGDPIEKSADSSFDADFSAPEPSDELSKEEDDTLNRPVEQTSEPVDLDSIREESFQKGIEAGTERAESDYGSSVKAMQAIFEQLSSIRETILTNSMTDMQDLVIKIAEKIIRDSVSEQKQTIVRTVEEAIQQAVKSDEFIISVHPDDYEIIKSKSAELITSLSGLENIILKANPLIDQGGCLIESNNCTVDATLASQLQLITTKIKSQ